jgi:hypothetical protein
VKTPNRKKNWAYKKKPINPKKKDPKPKISHNKNKKRKNNHNKNIKKIKNK